MLHKFRVVKYNQSKPESLSIPNRKTLKQMFQAWLCTYKLFSVCHLHNTGEKNNRSEMVRFLTLAGLHILVWPVITIIIPITLPKLRNALAWRVTLESSDRVASVIAANTRWFIALIATIVITIAKPLAWDAASTGASMPVLGARGDLAVTFIGIVTAIILAIAYLWYEDALVVRTSTRRQNR